MPDNHPTTLKKTMSKIISILPNNLTLFLKKKYYFRWLKKDVDQIEQDLNVVKRLLKKGDIAVDIGACYGRYTRFCSECVDNNGRVLSFEPIPETFMILETNVKKLSLKNVELFNYAVSDKNGKASMKIPKWDFGGQNYYRASLSDKGDITITTLCLDELWESIKDNGIKFIKCDAEGHEQAVIKGAKKIISNFKPSLLIEIDYQKNNKLFTLLEKQGYKAFWFNGKKLTKYNSNDTQKSSNYFFLQPEHIKMINELL